ncbi:MAG TPA: hypothetical protein VEB66_07695 [Opitutaceae bacterium]|nr:hypothetical protein [Opitutaceae bacterium]
MTKLRAKLLSLSLLASLAGAAAAWAEKVPGTPLPAPAPAEGGGWGNREGVRPGAELMKRFDRNGDGKLDEAERAALRGEVAKMDAKRPDGALRGEILARFDRDGDGRLNEAERAEFEQARAALLKQGASGARMRNRAIKEFDRDGDGKLSAGEEAAARAAMQNRRTGRKAGD